MLARSNISRRARRQGTRARTPPPLTAARAAMWPYGQSRPTSHSLEPAMATHESTLSAAATTSMPVIAQRVEDSQRLMALPRHFGNCLLVLEGTVYDFMRRFAPDYRGAFWNFYELSSGGFIITRGTLSGGDPQREGTRGTKGLCTLQIRRRSTASPGRQADRVSASTLWCESATVLRDARTSPTPPASFSDWSQCSGWSSRCWSARGSRG